MKYFEGGKAVLSPKCANDMPTIAFCTIEEMPAALKTLGFPEGEEFPRVDQYGTRFEVHKSFDSFTLHGNNLLPPEPDTYLGAVFNAMRLVIVRDESESVVPLTNALENGDIPCEIPAVLEKLLESAMVDNDDALEDIENELLQLEERIISDRLQDCVSEIMQIRKSLISYKRYYDGLLRVLQGLEENRNGYIHKHSLYTFQLLMGRADRLSAHITSLMDYAAQVREAYQNQIDIDLNQTMKLFTVITVIFLPLSLLAGWYGMNFHMPEYSWPWAYPAFIGISVVVIVCLLVYFKRKKWF